MVIKVGKPSIKLKREAEQIRRYALSFPETHEDFPWGHSAFKVKNKTFVFMSLEETGISVSIKLKESLFDALALPFAEPTGYGLGKSGWVTANFPPNKNIPKSLIDKWVGESFRLIAPKTILKQLDSVTAKLPRKSK
jgi:predicted DNA-binding protein (MmcQ/YjbR family)